LEWKKKSNEEIVLWFNSIFGWWCKSGLIWHNFLYWIQWIVFIGGIWSWSISSLKNNSFIIRKYNKIDSLSIKEFSGPEFFIHNQTKHHLDEFRTRTQFKRFTVDNSYEINVLKFFYYSNIFAHTTNRSTRDIFYNRDSHWRSTISFDNTMIIINSNKFDHCIE
jgi:hypothetical protein